MSFTYALIQAQDDSQILENIWQVENVKTCSRMSKSNAFYVCFDSDADRFTHIAEISEELTMWRIASWCLKVMSLTYALIQTQHDSQILRKYLKSWECEELLKDIQKQCILRTLWFRYTTTFHKYCKIIWNFEIKDVQK